MTNGVRDSCLRADYMPNQGWLCERKKFIGTSEMAKEVVSNLKAAAPIDRKARWRRAADELPDAESYQRFQVYEFSLNRTQQRCQ